MTTEKDYVRLPDDTKTMIHVLRVELKWTDPAAANQILEKISSDG